MAQLPARGPAPVSRVVRILGALAVLSAGGTFLAVQIDFVRRHTVGFPPMPPGRYWLPQLTQIWAPGLGGAALFAAAAFLLHRRRRRD